MIGIQRDNVMKKSRKPIQRQRHGLSFRLLAASTAVLALGMQGASATTCNPKEASPGVTATEIKLGATMPMSGSAATGGLGASAGAKAYFDLINAQGGVKGRKINYIVLDDQYAPAVAQRQMRQLVQRDEVFAIAGGEGTPNFLAVVPFLEREGVPAIAPYAPSSELGTMKTPHIYMTAVNYITEFEVMGKYVVENLKPKAFSLVGVQGNVGDDAKAGLDKAVAGTGIKVSYVPEVPGTPDMTPIASQLRDIGADWVFLILTNADTGQLLETMARIGYKPKTAAWAGMDDPDYLKAFGRVSQGMIVAEETAKIESDDPLVKTFVQQFTKQTGRAPGKFEELGWVQAQITVKALQDAEAPTRSCVMAALEKMKDFNTGILPPISFGPDVRQGVNALGLVRIEGEKTVEIVPFGSVK
jgi:ABC-type branched-subunit amino acid transport system substrate-binding protein